MTPPANAIGCPGFHGQGSTLGRFFCAFASGVSLLRAQGSGAPSSRLGGRRRLLLAALATAALFLAVGVAPAFAVVSFGAGLGCGGTDHTSIHMEGDIGNTLIGTEEFEDVHWSFAYSTTKGGPWTPVPGGGGTITIKEFEIAGHGYNVNVLAGLTGLAPEVSYYVLLTATNKTSTASGETSCETVPFRPGPELSFIHNPTATSAHLGGQIRPRGFETHWRFEYAAAEAGGQAPAEGSSAWIPVAGGEGTVSQAEAGALSEPEGVPVPPVEATLTGLSPNTAYYVRLFAEDEPALGVHKHATSKVTSFETEGRSTATTFATHAIYGEAIHVLGSVQLDGAATSEEQAVTIGGAPTGGTFTLAFEGQTTGAAGSGDLLSGAATGSGDLSVAHGFGTFAVGSTTVSNVDTVTGSFAVGQQINAEGVPAGTTITAVGAGTFTISASTTEVSGSGHPNELRAASPTISSLATSTGSFAVGQQITGAGIPEGATVTAVGAGTLTISRLPTVGGTVALVADSKIVSNVLTSTGTFIVGEAISGAGIPADTTITAVDAGAGALTLSANPTAGGVAVALTADLPFDASTNVVQGALSALSSIGKGNINVYGPAGGPFAVYFGVSPLDGRDLPQIVADASGLTPSGTVTVATTQNGGAGYDTHYHFEYVDQKHFEEQGGFAGPAARSTPEVDLGVGSGTVLVGADLPEVQPGETYRYRILATSTSPGNPVFDGAEQSLTVPATPQPPASGPAGEEPCGNVRFRTGPSAALPDCRAYEQLTPVDKEGATEPFHYGTQVGPEGALVGEDGEHLALYGQLTHWGSGLSPYFFSRDPEGGWQMTAGTPQPEAGVDHYEPELYSPDLTSFAFLTGPETSLPTTLLDREFKAGPPGGPYATVASVPVKDLTGVVGENTGVKGGWVAASEGFSKLILQVADRTLVPGHPTHTVSGFDLYEYSAGGLRQANVLSGDPGAPIGSCGARIARGAESVARANALGSRHAVSADGSRVFFEAVPGANCSEPKHLYMRTDGAVTRDLGAYTFIAADAQGARVLLQARSGETREFVLYDTESAVYKPLFSLHQQTPAGGELIVSEDFTAIYFDSPEHLTPEAPRSTDINLYRYDIPTETLHFLLAGTGINSGPPAVHNVSPDGRYAYFEGTVDGLPTAAANQAIRYDSVEHVVQCLSCASSFDPEPRSVALFGEGEGSEGIRSETLNGVPYETVASANGDFVFFDTISALVPQDVNGEVPPEPSIETGLLTSYTPSSDVYEWRRDGIDGCARLRGCLSLISSGRNGKLVALIGTTNSGRDVFFTTASQLVPADNDDAIDIYDARIGGGSPPPPPRPAECEGDSCSTPSVPPNDPTPSSSTFQGAGNMPAGALPEVKPKPKPKPKSKCKAKAKKKCKAKPNKKAGKKTKKAGSRRRAKR